MTLTAILKHGPRGRKELKMKKTMALLSVIMLNIVLLSACVSLNNENTNPTGLDSEVHSNEHSVQPSIEDMENDNTTPTESEHTVDFEAGIFFDKHWDETVGTYEGAVVPNKETAIEVAKSIFNGMEKNNDAQQYVPQTVFYDEQDGIWIVSFWKESNEIIVGGDCSIAIQKEDGKVLRIWYGE